MSWTIFVFSMSAFVLGLTITISTTQRILQTSTYELSIETVYLIVTLLATGLVGTVLLDAFRTILEKRVELFFETPSGKELLKNELHALLKDSSVLPELILSDEGIVNAITELQGDESEIDDPTHLEDFDTVIVPARWSWEWNIKKGLYSCQKDRAFKKTNYIALYADKQIRFVAKKGKKLSQRDVQKREDFEEIRLFLEQTFKTTVEESDFYMLDSGGIPNNGKLNILHKWPYALVLKQIYTNFNSLLTAKTTDQIKRQNR